MNRKYTIYAVDFDGTLCENTFPGIGSPNMVLINHLIKHREQGNKIVLWTCRVNEWLQEAVEWCRQHGLEFDAVNENLPEMVEYWGGESRKVFADVYIDDKAVNKPKYHVSEKKISEDIIGQATIRLPAKLTQKLQKAEMTLAKAPCHCDDFWVFPDDDNKRLVIAPTKENSVIDIEVERAKELVRIIQYQIQEWG